MKQASLTFYTVLCGKQGYLVKYVDPVAYCIKKFTGSFGDPGEASQEFKISALGRNACYLEEKQFQAKARAMAQLRLDERKKLREWNDMSGVTCSLMNGE